MSGWPVDKLLTNRTGFEALPDGHALVLRAHRGDSVFDQFGGPVRREHFGTDQPLKYGELVIAGI